MFSNLSIMIVEDEPLVALELEYTVTDMGGAVVGPFATVAAALSALECNPVAGAILDGQLQDRDITPVALQLASAGVPLVFYTGTGLPGEVLAIFPDLPIVMKPSHPSVAARLLDDIIDKKSPQAR